MGDTFDAILVAYPSAAPAQQDFGALAGRFVKHREDAKLGKSLAGKLRPRREGAAAVSGLFSPGSSHRAG